MVTARDPSNPGRRGERRRNPELRERVDELLDLVRRLSREGSELADDEMERRLQRIEWLAEEIWHAAAHGPREAPPSERQTE